MSAEKYKTCLGKPPANENACMTGFNHGLKKYEMSEEMASGPYARDYGEGYKAGREVAFKQTGSKRKTKKSARKTRRVKKLNGRK